MGVEYGVEMEGARLWWGWCLFVKVKEEAEAWGGDEFRRGGRGGGRKHVVVMTAVIQVEVSVMRPSIVPSMAVEVIGDGDDGDGNGGRKRRCRWW